VDQLLAGVVILGTLLAAKEVVDVLKSVVDISKFAMGLLPGAEEAIEEEDPEEALRILGFSKQEAKKRWRNEVTGSLAVRLPYRPTKQPWLARTGDRRSTNWRPAEDARPILIS
jgi:hypothetical protein